MEKSLLSNWRCQVVQALRVISGALLLSFVAPLLTWTYNPATPIHRLSVQYQYSCLYTVSIACVFMPLMPGLWIRTLQTQPLLKWGIRAAGTVAFTWVGTFIARALLQIVQPRPPFWADFYSSFRLALIISSACVAFVSLWETHKAQMQASAMEIKKKELERERALKLATEARLASLESRIHPHFLFNAINTVGSLIPDDPVRAERLLNQMAALLRFSLDSTRRGLVDLGQELKIVQDYLDIEQARFAGRLRHTISIPKELHAALVPPLSVQTLVENSIKFAVASSRTGASIEVGAEEAGSVVRISVTDDGPGFTEAALIGGHGLDNLGERLNVLFKGESSLSIESHAGRTRVSFTVPFTGTVPYAGLPAERSAG